jgi:hypothetical protein
VIFIYFIHFEQELWEQSEAFTAAHNQMVANYEDNIAALKEDKDQQLVEVSN